MSTAAERTRARLSDRIRTAIDSSGMSLELIDLANRFTSYRTNAHRRAARDATGSACEIPAADVEEIAAAALARFVDKLAQEGDWPKDFRTIRAWMSTAVRFAVADYMRERFADLLRDRADVELDLIAKEEQERDHEAELAAAQRTISQLPPETWRAAVAIACTESLTDAAHAADVSRSTLYRHLASMRESVETPIGGLYRSVCEALDELRTGQPVILSHGLTISAGYSR